MILCKLTDKNIETYDGFQWVLGKKETIKTTGGLLCSNDFFHYYTDPLLAVLLNPIHAKIKNPRIFLVEAGGERINDKGLKVGSKELTLTEEIKLPEVTLNQLIAFSILCALEVTKNTGFVSWATNWLNGTDRTKESAARAADSWAAYWAAHAAASADAAGARAASWAAATAFWDDASRAARAVDAASCAAMSAAMSAASAAAYAEAARADDLDLISLAKKAMVY